MPLTTLRSFVNTWNIDEMGHMNVQFYVSGFTSALAHLADALGHGMPEAIDHGAALTARTDQIVYAREMRLAVNFKVESRVLAANDTHLTILHVMINMDADEIAASCLSEVVLRDIATDKDRPLPKSIIDAATKLIEAPVDAAMPRPQGETPAHIDRTMATAHKVGMKETCRNVVQADMLDAHGRMQPRFSMGSYSDGASNMWRNAGLLENPEDTGVGGAVVQTKMTYHSHARIGQTFAILGGFWKAGSASVTSAQWLVDARTGAPITTADTVAVMFDTSARKACPLTDEDRAKFEATKLKFED